MYDVLRLTEERREKIGQARALLDGAENEKRELRGAENERFEALLREVDTLGDRIGQLDPARRPGKRAARGGVEGFRAFLKEKECPGLLGRLLAGGPIGPAERTETAPVFCVVGHDGGGKEVRALGPGDRMASLPWFLPDGIRPEELSLGRAVRALATGSWQGAEAERRAMGEASGATGGWLVPSALSTMVIDLARAKAVCQKAGALTIPIDAPEVTIAKVSQDPTAQWRAEHEEITVSDGAFEPIKIKPRALGCVIRTSLELLQDATQMQGLLEDAMAAAIALKLDYAALLGAGAGEPLGLRNTPGVLVYDATTGEGAIPSASWDDLSNAIQLIRGQNGEPNAAVYHPQVAGQLDRLKNLASGYLAPPESVAKLARYDTTQIPINLGDDGDQTLGFVGDFKQLLFAMRTELQLEVARSGASKEFEKMQVLIRAYLRADVAVLRAPHFCQITNWTA